MCPKPKMPPKEDPNPTVVTKQDGQQYSGAAARRKRSAVRVDLNNATSPYKGLTIPE